MRGGRTPVERCAGARGVTLRCALTRRLGEAPATPDGCRRTGVADALVGFVAERRSIELT